MKTPIKSIAEEKADCIAAHLAHPNAIQAWTCHHGIILELLDEPFMNRVSYILSNKPLNEQAVRFRNFRPVKDEAAIKAARVARAAGFELARNNRSAAIKAANVVYDEATAGTDSVSKSAEDAYCAACKYAGEVLDTSYNQVWDTYNTTIQWIHDQEWPDHTWTGKDIFGN